MLDCKKCKTHWQCRAIANIGLGNIDEALSHLFQLTNTEAIVTHDIEIYLLRSRLYIIQDKIFYAAADLKIALQINPKHPGIHSLACKVMAAANQFKNKASEQIIRNDLNLAIWYLNQAIELDPEDYKTLMLRGKCAHLSPRFIQTYRNYSRKIE